MNAADLITNRRQTTSTKFVDHRVKESEKITKRRVLRGKVQYRNAATGEYKIDTGDGKTRWAKSITSSDLAGKDVIMTVSNMIGQVSEMPGFS